MSRVVHDFNKKFSFSDAVKKAQPVHTPRVNTYNIVKPSSVKTKQKLSDIWVLWSHHIEEKAWDMDSYTKICEIEHDEDFEWLVQNFPPYEDYIIYLFRRGVCPIYEDSRNINGGRFSFKVNRLYYKETWEELSRALISDFIVADIDDSDSIMGISINPRTHTVQIWNNDHNNNKVSVLNKSVQRINYNNCIYKPHEVDTSRKAETGFKTQTDNTNPNKSEEQKIDMITRKLDGLIGKLVKSNVSDFAGKLVKLEELFGKSVIYKSLIQYPLIKGDNENDYMYIKYKLQLLSGLQCGNMVFKYLYEKYSIEYTNLLISIEKDIDISPKNIAELEEGGKIEEINQNIEHTRIRNKIHEITNLLFFLVSKGYHRIENEIINEFIMNNLKNTIHPSLLLDGPLRLVLIFKSRLNKELFVEKITELKGINGLNRKIRFAIEDTLKFLETGEKSQTVKELFELFD